LKNNNNNAKKDRQRLWPGKEQKSQTATAADFHDKKKSTLFSFLYKFSSVQLKKKSHFLLLILPIPP